MEEVIHFQSGPVRLEGRMAYRDELIAIRARVLLCGPHPFLGGDMDNNVMTALSQQLADADCMVLRFNYRGIGASETDRDLSLDQQAFWENSTCPDYEADILGDSDQALETLLAGMDTGAPVCVVGYSFGCLPALRLARTRKLDRLALISPPLAKWPIRADELPLCTDTRLFYSTDDFACPPGQLEALAAGHGQSVGLQRFGQADHFFIGRELELATAVAEFIGGDDV